MLGLYVKPMEWGCPLLDTPTPGPDEAQSIINCWNPFDKMDYSTAHMRKLYPNLLRILVAARAEEYSIPFLNYMDKKSYYCVVKDGMFIRNHDFDESAELV